MTADVAEGHNVDESRASSARYSMSWALIGSVAANAALVVVLWGVHLTTVSHSIVNEFCGMATTMLILSCHALVVLFTIAGKPASVGRILLGMGLMAGIIVALAASPFCRHPWLGIIGGLVAIFTASPLLAAAIMRLFGLRLCLSGPRQESSSLQFSIRSLFVVTAIAACYALLISSIMEDGVVLSILRDLSPQSGVDGGDVALMVVLCHVTVVAMSLVLWRTRLIAHIALLGLLLVLPLLFDLSLPLPREGIYIMALLGTCLLGLVGTIFPLMIAGVHATWEKPVFEW